MTDNKTQLRIARELREILGNHGTLYITASPSLEALEVSVRTSILEDVLECHIDNLAGEEVTDD